MRMNSRTLHPVICTTAAVAAFSALPLLAGAAVINPNAGAFPTASATSVVTVDANNAATSGNRGISTTRVERQSFSVSSDITVTSIFISANNYSNAAFTITIYADPTVLSSPIAVGAQIGSTITVPAAGSTVTGYSNIEVDLSPSEQFTLTGNATDPATTGYIISIQLADSTSGLAFNWVHSNTGSDLYAGGRYYRDGDSTATRDFGVAFTSVASTATPEPATAGSLLVFGAATLLRRRRA